MSGCREETIGRQLLTFACALALVPAVVVSGCGEIDEQSLMPDTIILEEVVGPVEPVAIAERWGADFTSPSAIQLDTLQWAGSLAQYRPVGWRPGTRVAREIAEIRHSEEPDFSQVAAAQASCQRGLMSRELSSDEYEDCIGATLVMEVPVVQVADTIYRETIVEEDNPVKGLVFAKEWIKRSTSDGDVGQPSFVVEPMLVQRGDPLFDIWQIDGQGPHWQLRMVCRDLVSEEQGTCGPGSLGPMGSWDARDSLRVWEDDLNPETLLARGFAPGKTRFIGYMDDGYLVGPYAVFNSDGELARSGRMADWFPGEPIAGRYAYQPDGRTTTPYTGTVISDPETDSVNSPEVGHLENGFWSGPYRTYHSNGQIRVEGGFSGGRRHGIWRSRWESGVISQEVQYQNGLRHGRWRRYCEVPRTLLQAGTSPELALRAAAVLDFNGADVSVQNARWLLEQDKSSVLSEEDNARLREIVEEGSSNSETYTCLDIDYESGVRVGDDSSLPAPMDSYFEALDRQRAVLNTELRDARQSIPEEWLGYVSNCTEATVATADCETYFLHDSGAVVRWRPGESSPGISGEGNNLRRPALLADGRAIVQIPTETGWEAKTLQRVEGGWVDDAGTLFKPDNVAAREFTPEQRLGTFTFDPYTGEPAPGGDCGEFRCGRLSLEANGSVAYTRSGWDDFDGRVDPDLLARDRLVLEIEDGRSTRLIVLTADGSGWGNIQMISL